jgi:hypothetical protein
MMEKSPFQYEEALAVARLIWSLVTSDKELTTNELNYLQQTFDYLNITLTQLYEYLKGPEDTAYETVRKMPFRKRNECARLLRLAFNSNELVNRVELNKLNDILTRAELFKNDQKSSKQDIEILL